MPEGPSIVILREQATPLLGKTIARVQGNTTIEKERLLGQRIEALRSWGKHFLLGLPDFSLRVHFMLFGRYRIVPLVKAHLGRTHRRSFFCEDCQVKYG